MEKELIGKKIARVALDNYDGLVKQGFMQIGPEEYELRLVGKTIRTVFNKEKYFLFGLEPSDYLFFWGSKQVGTFSITRTIILYLRKI